MQKRHFEAIARSFVEARGDFGADATAEHKALDHLADYMASELGFYDPRFDRERFLKACGVN